MTKPTDRIVFVTANGINKTLKQAIIDGDLSGGGGGGSGIIEVFNLTVLKSSNSSTLTGLVHFKAPQAMTVNKVGLQIFEKGSIVTGSLTIDIKKNSTPDNVGMTSIFTTLPTTNFAVNSNYAYDSGVLDSAQVNLNNGDWLRLDITSIPTGLGKFYIQVFGA